MYGSTRSAYTARFGARKSNHEIDTRQVTIALQALLHFPFRMCIDHRSV